MKPARNGSRRRWRGWPRENPAIGSTPTVERNRQCGKARNFDNAFEVWLFLFVFLMPLTIATGLHPDTVLTKRPFGLQPVNCSSWPEPPKVGTPYIEQCRDCRIL